MGVRLNTGNRHRTAGPHPILSAAIKEIGEIKLRSIIEALEAVYAEIFVKSAIKAKADRAAAGRQS
jgi:hypothetical protein